MYLQHEQLLEDIENASTTDITINSIIDEADENVSTLIKDIEESTNNFDTPSSCTQKSPSSSTSSQRVTTISTSDASTQKITTVSTPDISNKKNVHAKKKRVADMR